LPDLYNCIWEGKMKVAKHKINAKKTKHFVYGKHTKKVPIMRTVFTRIVNIVLRASLLCAVFVLGGLNKGFAESNQCLVLKHQRFVERHKGFCETNKYLFYKNKSPP